MLAEDDLRDTVANLRESSGGAFGARDRFVCVLVGDGRNVIHSVVPVAGCAKPRLSCALKALAGLMYLACPAMYNKVKPAKGLK